MEEENNIVKKVCYVCGLKLDHTPYYAKKYGDTISGDIELICSCCGVHYEYDDAGASNKFNIPDELIDESCEGPDSGFGRSAHKKILTIIRKDWIKNGMKWWFPYTNFPNDSQPSNWNPIEQLRNVPEDFMDEDTRKLIESRD
jgi:hypothetical protein